MNRQIKFRGLVAKTSRWAYGYYIVIGDRHFIAERDVEFRTHGLDEADYGEQPETGIYGMTEVIPETVGEYTGLKDKNGVEIYEGDIIKYMDGNNMVVQWSSSGYIGWELYRKKKMGKNIHHVKYMYYDHSPYPNAHEEVIGNIHRNPELLE